MRAPLFVCHRWLRSPTDSVSYLEYYKHIDLAERKSVSEGQKGVLVLLLLVLCYMCAQLI